MDDAAAIRHHRHMPGLRVESAALLAMLVPSVAIANGLEVRDFARAPAFAYAALAPNGASVSYVDQVDGEQVVFTRVLADGTAIPTLRVKPPRERIRWCDWADDRYVLCGTILIARAQHALIERTKLYAIDAANHRVRELNARDEQGARDQVIDMRPMRPGVVLVQRDVDGRGFPEVAELAIDSGKLRTIVRARPPVRSWMSDGRGTVRLGLGYDNGVATLLVRDSVGETWRPLIEQSLADPDAVGPLAFGPNAAELYVLKHHRGRAALFSLDLARGAAPTLLFADPLFDVSGPLVLDPRSRELLAVRYLHDAPAIHFFAARERELHAWLDRELPDASNEIAARSSDGTRVLVTSSSDTKPPSLYVANLESRRIALLGHQYPELEPRTLAPMQTLMYRARDGQRIPAYLTTPSGRAQPGPAIVLPHGGPETRTVRRFDPLVQFLVARGYAVLQPNFRGSLGYGAGFAAAGARQWGGVVHNDITDGARWLVEQKIADPARVCIAGASFGGYAALLGAARESQWYACAASFGGTSDLMAFAEFTRRLPDAPMWQERLGGDSRALWQMSPLALARHIETPVLLLHGLRDAVVPISQSRRLRRALHESSKTHRLVELTDCDHEMTAESCRREVFAALDEFLQRSLERE